MVKMAVVIAWIALLGVSNAAYICPNITGRVLTPIPSLDDKQFSYKIQITVEDLNKTLDGYEFYDHENQTIFLSLDQTVGSEHNQSRKSMTYDYQYNQTYTVDEVAGSCKVDDIVKPDIHRLTLFGVGVENWPGMPVQHSFYWNNNYNATNEGVEVIDGITTDHFQTCLTFDGYNWTYLVDIYFSAVNWSMPSGQRAPVLLKLDATNNMNQSREYTYKFSDYHTSTSEREWRPHKPSGMICHGRRDAPKFDNFTVTEMQLDTQFRMEDSVIQTSEYVDMNKKVERFDVAVALYSVVTIHDFNQGYAYSMDKIKNTCTVGTIPPESPYMDSIPDGHNTSLVRIKSIWETVKQENMTYGGIGEYQGIPAHIWIGQNLLKTVNPVCTDNTTAWLQQTFYHSVQKFNKKPLFLGVAQKLTCKNATSSMTYDMIGHTYNVKDKVDSNAFDVSDCYKTNQKQTVVIKFSFDDVVSVKANKTGFHCALEDTVREHANVSLLRVMISGESLIPARKNGSGLYFWIMILDTLDFAGDSVYMTPESNLSMALNSLQKAVNDDTFIVNFNVGTQQKEVAAFSDYWMTTDDMIIPPSAPPAPTPGPAKAMGWSTGSVVGLAIGMVVLGFILGYIVHIWRGKRGNAQYAYTMQD